MTDLIVDGERVLETFYNEQEYDWFLRFRDKNTFHLDPHDIRKSETQNFFILNEDTEDLLIFEPPSSDNCDCINITMICRETGSRSAVQVAKGEYHKFLNRIGYDVSAHYDARRLIENLEHDLKHRLLVKETVDFLAERAESRGGLEWSVYFAVLAAKEMLDGKKNKQM